MARPLPPLDLLVGFEVAARQLSFSKAGEEIFLTQSAISRQVKKLEEYLGVDLFERHHRALVLTDQGKLLFEVTSELLKGISNTVEILRAQPQQRGLRISATTSFSALWLVPHLARFNAIHPEIAVQIAADNRLFDLPNNNVDLAIRYCAPDQAPDNTILTLANEQIFPVCSPALLRRNGRTINTAEDLCSHTLLHLEDVNNSWPWLQWRSWLEIAAPNLKKPAISLSFSHYDQLIHAACLGHGIALGSSPLVNRMLDEGILVCPLKDRLKSPRSFHLIGGHRQNQEISAFIAWITDEMAAKNEESFPLKVTSVS